MIPITLLDFFKTVIDGTGLDSSPRKRIKSERKGPRQNLKECRCINTGQTERRTQRKFRRSSQTGERTAEGQ